jgi:DNA ligase D-like protein (predicted ligase)
MPFAPVKPMLASSGKPFSQEGWIFEPKFDGTRAIAFVTGDSVILQNRRGNLISARYPEITSDLRDAVKGNCILDGELVVLTPKGVDFAALQVREQQSDPLKIAYLARTHPADYIVFDILSAGEQDLTDAPLRKRKEILRGFVQDTGRISVIEYRERDGERYCAAALQLGFEGIIAKDLSAPYQPGVRSRDWIKIKRIITLDLVVGGYSRGTGSRRATFGALLLGAFDSGGNLHYISKAGSGFSQRDLATILELLEPTVKSSFLLPPHLPGVVWVKPSLVVEVQAMEVTAQGHLRAPVFRMIRRDKTPDECTCDQIGAELLCHENTPPYSSGKTEE